MLAAALLVATSLVPDLREQDPEVVDIIEELVEIEGGWLAAQAWIDNLAQEFGFDSNPEDEPACRLKWLPSLALRFSWSPDVGARRGKWEFMILVVWPLGT